MPSLRDIVRCGAVAACLALAVGCADGLGGEVPSSEAFDYELPPPISDNPEHITVVGEDFDGDPSSSGLITDEVVPAEAPCGCPEDDYDCLADWAKGEFGCDVCVTVLCGGAPGPHVCTEACE